MRTRTVVFLLCGLLVAVADAGPLDNLEGNPDPAAPIRVSRVLAFDGLVAAIYGDDRAGRLAAIDAASHLEDPWPALPYMAALMGASDRQVAARASRALTALTERVAARRLTTSENVPARGLELGRQLSTLATDPRLDLDVRVAALRGLGRLEVSLAEVELDLGSLFEDEDEALRRATLAVLDVPLAAGELPLVARVATGDGDPRTAAQAVALVCENALAHGVEAPSADLARLLESVLGDGTVPGEALGPVLACCFRFNTDARAGLIDLARGHPDPSVGELCDAFSKR